MNATSHWDQYWLSSKSLNSFGEGEAASGYQGELLSFWQSQFACLPPEATLVDIGTGNGAIVVAAREFSNARGFNFTLHGIDAANIQPLRVFKNDKKISDLLATVYFHSACKVEQMPFGDESVDMLTSQFAFEYAAQKAALTECLRVLKPGGRLVAVMHHSGSELAKDSEAGMQVLAGFLLDSPFFKQAADLLHCLDAQARVPAEQQDRMHCKRLNQELLTTVQLIRQGCPDDRVTWFNDVMSRVAKIIMQVPPNYRQHLESLHQNLLAFYHRLVDQHQASLSPAAAQMLRDNLFSSNLNFSLQEIQIENQLFGWFLKIVK